MKLKRDQGHKEEVFKALTIPNVDWEKDAAEYVFERSIGYPIVVQLYGAVCYLKRTKGTITKELVQEADKEIKQELWQWFQNSWKDMPSRLEARCIAIVAKYGMSASYSQIQKSFGKVPAPYLKRAVEKHILSQDERGIYSLPHMLVAEIFLEKYKEEIKST